MDKRNTMLLGVPRSGTTLACHIINKLQNAVALHEPLMPKIFEGKLPSEIMSIINTFIDVQRLSLLKNGTAVSKTIGGVVPDNHLNVIDSNVLKRVSTIDSQTLVLSKELSHDFSLIIKHCSFFVGILESLMETYRCFAIIRNPLSTLLSWNSVELSVAHGYAPAAEMFDNRLSKELSIESDKYDRQIILLTWFYNKIYECLPKENIILYEDIISSRGNILKKIVPEAEMLIEPLTSKNNNPFYNNDLKPLLAKKLMSIHLKGGYKFFYNEEELLQINCS